LLLYIFTILAIFYGVNMPFRLKIQNSCFIKQFFYKFSPHHWFFLTTPKTFTGTKMNHPLSMLNYIINVLNIDILKAD